MTFIPVHFIQKKCQNCKWFHKSYDYIVNKDMCDHLDRKGFFTKENNTCSLFEKK